MNNVRYPPTPQRYPSWNVDANSYHLPSARTPSPTLSETAELSRAGAFDWSGLAQWRFWFRREWLWYYIALVFVCVVTTLVTLYHQQIVDFLRPAADWMHEIPAGFMIPIAVLFIISFPPLFGHEIVAILCGLVWGLWTGFGIVCAGTFIGEVGNFYAFKHCCRSRGEKLERTNIAYGCLAKVVRDGGFTVALIARLSAIPGHFTTAVFSTCGMSIAVFSLAALLSLPKQFITVYLGVVLEQAADGEKSSTQDTVLKYCIIAITLVITVWAMWYIYAQMGKVKTQVIYERRKARQMANSGLGNYSNDVLAHAAPMAAPRSTRPPNPDDSSQGQKWGECGDVVRWSDRSSSLQTTEDPFHEERDTPSHGSGFTTRKHHYASHSAGPHVYGCEVLVNPFDPRQHLRTRSLAAFHGDPTVDNPDPLRETAAGH